MESPKFVINVNDAGDIVFVEESTLPKIAPVVPSRLKETLEKANCYARKMSDLVVQARKLSEVEKPSLWKSVRGVFLMAVAAFSLTAVVFLSLTFEHSQAALILLVANLVVLVLTSTSLNVTHFLDFSRSPFWITANAALNNLALLMTLLTVKLFSPANVGSPTSATL